MHHRAPHRRQRVIAHLVASPFFGGPERQLLGLARSLSDQHRTEFISFHERGLAAPFEHAARGAGFSVTSLVYNAPRYMQCIREIASALRQVEADVVCCHGYKADIIGLAAARHACVPAIGVSRGWTGATLKVCLNEWLDRACLHGMHRVVCVSDGQARKVRRAFVANKKVVVIRNAIDAGRFAAVDPAAGRELRSFFACDVEHVIVAAGRLSPEKGFDQLVAAAALVQATRPKAGFVVFGDGPMRQSLDRQIVAAKLKHFVLAGFRTDVDRLLAHASLVAIPSYTEGLPNIALEAHAAGVAIVATSVGGIPEVVESGVTGRLVAAGNPNAMAHEIELLLGEEALRAEMGRRGRAKVKREFTFDAQARAYEQLFDELLGCRSDETTFEGDDLPCSQVLVRQ
jgi:glycosyltransferase involved in cell wall biosynthesis